MAAIRYNPELWTPIEQRVWETFQYSCIVCLHHADVIHEIEPKSKRPKDWWKFENRALLCIQCHYTVHAESSRVWRKRLIEFRDLRLKQYGYTIT